MGLSLHLRNAGGSITDSSAEGLESGGSAHLIISPEYDQKSRGMVESAMMLLVSVITADPWKRTPM
jgi:hypothetical protein